MITPYGQALMSFITWLNTYASTEFILAMLFGIMTLLSWRLFRNSLATPHPQYQFLIIFVVDFTTWITLAVNSFYV